MPNVVMVLEDGGTRRVYLGTLSRSRAPLGMI